MVGVGLGQQIGMHGFRLHHRRELCQLLAWMRWGQAFLDEALYRFEFAAAIIA
jgi:hypothetical protein